eukprot:4782569-Amphidinium_carterae.1
MHPCGTTLGSGLLATAVSTNKKCASIFKGMLAEFGIRSDIDDHLVIVIFRSTGLRECGNVGCASQCLAQRHSRESLLRKINSLLIHGDPVGWATMSPSL